MGSNGFEPSTSRLSGARSNRLSYEPMSQHRILAPGGDEEVRTLGLLRARQALSQLSYTPMLLCEVPSPFSVYTKKGSGPSKLNNIFRASSSPDLRSFHPLLYGCLLLRKEVIQPHLLIRLPCYDFTPVINPTFDSSLPCGLGCWLRVLPTSMV